MTTTPAAPLDTATARTAPARSVAELDHHGTRSHEVYTAGFYASDWDYVVRSLLGKASRGGADAGEVLATIAAIEPEDRAVWFAAWVVLGKREHVGEVGRGEDQTEAEHHHDQQHGVRGRRTGSCSESTTSTP